MPLPKRLKFPRVASRVREGTNGVMQVGAGRGLWVTYTRRSRRARRRSEGMDLKGERRRGGSTQALIIFFQTLGARPR